MKRTEREAIAHLLDQKPVDMTALRRIVGAQDNVELTAYKAATALLHGVHTTEEAYQ